MLWQQLHILASVADLERNAFVLKRLNLERQEFLLLFNLLLAVCCEA